ncbi:BRAP2 RING ZnF UBP domain-containing protein 2 isoform X3 [Populus trichocarpa]|uniref:BRAP2 RING ZnF UBP domain-containing protein 2 isoform X3 n=1 Tax=Populus trichocarpa TaxID=3694 RepID=UPI000D189F75|nr:BRAP2 RING ZnF UBP domain-containing protein 2 isoform X3 [Populus trichocarpa]|eukprot:XP_024461472.1 BRCA1-associated protein isoform X3 [Populus trichocarpa]
MFSTAMSSSSSTAAVSRASPEDHFWQLTAEESSSSLSKTLPFSSGNPRIEETRGVMHLFSNDAVSDLPVRRKPLVAVIGVPNHMTYADFCQFCASFIDHILEMRIVRLDGMEDQYSILIRFDTQDSTDKFYLHFNGRQYNSLEYSYRKKCARCFSQLMSSSLVTVVHSNTLSHLQQAQLNSLHVQFVLVCRYCQQQPEKSICIVCQTSENLWICVLCGFVGCGRYKGGHAIQHWKETQHCYSLELDTQRVWDYVGDNYVHRLIQSKTDGKLVELNSPNVHAYDCCGGCDCADSGVSEALLNSKVEAIVNEYNELLATQLENQNLFFGTLLEEVEEETEREISKAVKKAIAQKLQKFQAKLDRCIKEKKFLDDLNENLVKNQEIWKAKISEIEEREKMALKIKDDKIQDLEEQLRDLMVSLEAGNTVEQLCISNELKDEAFLPILVESSSGKSPKGGKKANNQRKS